MPYFVFEGLDGTGKSTIALQAVDYLGRQMGKTVVHIRNPGATILGQRIRQITKFDLEVKMDPFTEQLLMACDHSATIHEIVIPALAKDEFVISDRSNVISGYAYGIPNNLDIKQFQEIHRVIKSPKIDILFIFDCLSSVARQRITLAAEKEGGDRAKKDRFESRGAEFFEKVHKSYQDMDEINTPLHHIVRKLAKNIVMVDANPPIEEVWNSVKADINNYIKNILSGTILEEL